MSEKNKKSGSGEDYKEELLRRGQESHIYSEHQMMGLMIAEILGDEEHKALYMKLAKEGNPDMLLRLAKSVAERKNVENKGAYFMSMLSDMKKEKR